ncbi:MAG: hypothetical protein ACXVLX_20070 [Ilumatobacteraceae bacterium]
MTSDGARACLIIVIVVAAINLWKLAAGLDSDPVLHRSGLTEIKSYGVLPGVSTIDPNDGVTLQALGRAAADQWLDGSVPYWNRFEGVGAPLAGEMQSMALHPFVLLQRLPQGFLLNQILMESLAGIATVFFLRRLGIGNAVSLGAGIAFACNGTFAWLSNAAASPVLYLPLLLWGVEIARDSSQLKRRGGWALIAVAIAGSLYAGFPETAYINGLFVGIWCLVRLEGLGREAMYRFLAKLAAGATAGLLLAAPILVAFIDYLPRGNVGAHTGYFGIATLHRSAISALYMPYVYGPIDAFNGSTTSVNIGGFWSSIGGYLSTVQLMLALLTIGMRRLRLMQLAVLGWLIVYLSKTYRFTPVITIVNWVPGMKATAFYRYSQPSVTMAMLVLAAYGAQRILDERISWRQVGACAAAVAVMLVWMALYARNETRHFVNAAHYRLYYLGSFGFALGGAVVAGSIALEPHLKRKSLVLASLLALDAVILFVVPEFSTFRTTAVDTAPVEFLRDHLGLQRFFTLGPITPNYGSYFGIAEVNEDNLPVPKAWGAYVVAHLDANTNPLVFTPDYRLNPDGPSTLDEFTRNLRNFAGIGTKYLVTNTDPEQAKQIVAAGLRQAFDDGQVSIFEVPDVADYFHTVDPSCKVSPVNWQSADVTCASPSTLVRLELSDPGWSATRNGADATISTTGEIFQSVDVPAGTTRVTFRFAPQHILLAWLAAVAALIWIVAWRLWPVRKEPVTDDASPEPTPERTLC